MKHLNTISNNRNHGSIRLKTLFLFYKLSVNLWWKICNNWVLVLLFSKVGRVITLIKLGTSFEERVEAVLPVMILRSNRLHDNNTEHFLNNVCVPGRARYSECVFFFSFFTPKGFILKSHYSEDFNPEGSLFWKFLSPRVIYHSEEFHPERLLFGITTIRDKQILEIMTLRNKNLSEFWTLRNIDLFPVQEC